MAQRYYRKQRSGIIQNKGLGLIHIYYGEGVGKTTAAVGLATRAAGRGLKVEFVQFMKSGNSGEIVSFQKIPTLNYYCPGKHPFILSKGPEPIHFDHARKALSYANNCITNSTNLLICDEILDTLLFHVLKESDIIDLMKNCEGRVELVMTGRAASKKLIKMAHYVTNFVQIKHPYYEGAIARKGIEY